MKKAILIIAIVLVVGALCSLAFAWMKWSLFNGTCDAPASFYARMRVQAKIGLSLGIGLSIASVICFIIRVRLS